MKDFIIPLPNATNCSIRHRQPEYITFFTPKPSAYTKHRLWHNAYHNEIFDLYQIYMRKMNLKFPKNDINWKDIRIYNDFSRFLYRCSSKYIVEQE